MSHCSKHRSVLTMKVQVAFAEQSDKAMIFLLQSLPIDYFISKNFDYTAEFRIIMTEHGVFHGCLSSVRKTSSILATNCDAIQLNFKFADL